MKKSVFALLPLLLLPSSSLAQNFTPTSYLEQTASLIERPQPERPGGRPEETLELVGRARPERLVGRFEHQGLALRFSSIETNTGIQFTLTRDDGTPLYEIQSTEELISISVLGGVLIHDVDQDLISQGAIQWDSLEPDQPFIGLVIGDEAAALQLWETPEMRILPYLSQQLGSDFGFTGMSHPASLPIHLLAAQLVDRTAAQARTELKESMVSAASSTCEPYPFPEQDCYGMCGPGCTCWSWVCGDCCFHTGCAVHDDYCRISWAHPYCIDFWIPFLIGGGC